MVQLFKRKIVPAHAMKAHGEQEVQLHSFLISKLWDQWQNNLWNHTIVKAAMQYSDNKQTVYFNT